MNQKRKLIITILVMIFVLSGFFSMIFGENVFVLAKNRILRLAGVYTEAIPSVTISQTGYEQQTPGTWEITKSAKWTGLGKAEVTFDVQSITKLEDTHKDIVLVMDISGSMYGEKLEKAKQDSIDLVETILSDSNNRIAFITFDSGSTIVSPFTNNKETLMNQIQAVSDRGTTNYNSALKNALEVLEGYQKQTNKDLVMLFLTDGYPNEDIHNEIATYEILKEKYPYMTIQGIQYEMGTEIHEDIKNISDNQFIADMTTLENVLFEASINPYIYEEFIIIDYIHDDYFEVGNVNDIKVPYGTIQLVPEGTGQKIIWDLSGLYQTGTNVQMNINLTLKQQYIEGEGFYPTNRGEDISSKLPEESKKEVHSDKTPVLQSSYQVIYDSNVPTGCAKQDLPTEKHMVYEVVEKKDTELTCPGYQFKGWFYDLEDEKDIQKVNDDTFIMPEHDVKLRGTWTKIGIEKNMNGEVKKLSRFATDSWETIVRNVREGNTDQYDVGDERDIDLGTLGVHRIRIANKSTPAECSQAGFSQTACGFVLEFADVITTHNMNPAGEYKGINYQYGWNVDGWPASAMRTYVNSDIYNAIPEALRNGIIDTTVVSGHGSTAGETNFTSTDKLYLLSTHEVWEDVDGDPNSGIHKYDTAYNQTRQLDYYAGKNVTTSNYAEAIKQQNGSNYSWWLRSAGSNYDNRFNNVYYDGDWNANNATATNGVAPAFRIGRSFETDTWEQVVDTVQSGKTSIYNVGDTKEIDLGTLGTHTVRIANKSTPTECSGAGFSQTACGFVLEFADIITTHNMNDTSTNVGGWPVTSMRTYVNSDIYNVIPEALRNAIIDTTVVSGHGATSGETNFTSTDKVYLLSPMEVWGNNSYSQDDSARDQSRQLDYYLGKGVNNTSYADAIKQNNGTVSWWWLRAAYSIDDYIFNNVFRDGCANGSNARSTGGVAPAFRIG